MSDIEELWPRRGVSFKIVEGWKEMARDAAMVALATAMGNPYRNIPKRNKSKSKPKPDKRKAVKAARAQNVKRIKK